jgi:hypothetical protein
LAAFHVTGLRGVKMIISHSHKFIFIKSHKTAGTSIEAALTEHCSGNDIVTPLLDYSFNRNEKGEWIHQSMNAGDFHQHEDALTIKNKLPADVWNSYFKFSITRNPWDRAVSFFCWEKRQDPALRPKKRFYHHLGIPFNDLAQTRKLFSEFIKGDWTSNDRFYTIDDQLCVDFVIRYEHLADDFSEVCKITGVPAKTLPHLKSGMRKKKYHYSEYYDEECRNIVAERHKNDLRLFEYVFERMQS